MFPEDVEAIHSNLGIGELIDVVNAVKAKEAEWLMDKGSYFAGSSTGFFRWNFETFEMTEHYETVVSIERVSMGKGG